MTGTSVPLREPSHHAPVISLVLGFLSQVSGRSEAGALPSQVLKEPPAPGVFIYLSSVLGHLISPFRCCYRTSQDFVIIRDESYSHRDPETGGQPPAGHVRSPWCCRAAYAASSSQRPGQVNDRRAAARPAGRRAAGGQPREGTALGRGRGDPGVGAEHRPPRPRAAPRAGRAPECAHRPHPTFGAHSPARWAAGRSVAAGMGSSGLRESAGLTARTPRGPVYTRDRAAPAPPPARPPPTPGSALTLAPPPSLPTPGSALALAPPPAPPRPESPHPDRLPGRRVSGELGRGPRAGRLAESDAL